jgi:hypothetical protein
MAAMRSGDRRRYGQPQPARPARADRTSRCARSSR